jgi:glycosyltransferase involved in cell wall biosynthesis
LGRLNALKGPKVLIEAAPMIAKEFPNCSIVLVGPDQVGYRSSLEKRAAELGVASNVQFTGPIYELEEKMQAYSACDLFVMPTTYEGTSQAIFEAMAQGKPVVASRVGGIPSQIEDGVDGMLVEYGSSEALGEAILKLLRDKSLMESMGASSRRKAPSFCYSKLAKTMERIYGETLRN